jgi:hypothetical protein
MFKSSFMRHLAFFLLLSPSLSSLQASAPSGSWEEWIEKLRSGVKPTPPRPDGKNMLLPLPLWVDCHLSWISDQPKNKFSLPDGIVLQTSPKMCRNQMENWAR